MTSRERADARFRAEVKRSRVCVKITYTYTHPWFFVDGHREKGLVPLQRVIVVPHRGAITEDAAWDEHLYKLIHPDRRRRSGTRLDFPEWLGDNICPRKWEFCTPRGRPIQHKTARQLQVARAEAIT